jgi:hypothetical protein
MTKVIERMRLAWIWYVSSQRDAVDGVGEASTVDVWFLSKGSISLPKPASMNSGTKSEPGDIFCVDGKPSAGAARSKPAQCFSL